MSEPLGRTFFLSSTTRQLKRKAASESKVIYRIHMLVKVISIKTREELLSFRL